MDYTYTTVDQLRKAFRKQHPHLSFKKIKNYTGNGTMHNTDTRTAWCNWTDALMKDGEISHELNDKATLGDDD